jgi:hypothetical protein
VEIWWITSNNAADEGCRLRVERTSDPSYGTLIIHDNGRDVVSERVRLSYNAIFGPDVQDVQDWQNRFERYLDHERQGQEHGQA